MSNDFWWGMACIPAAALAVCPTLGSVAWLIHVSARYDLGTYKLWPKAMRNDQRPVLAAIAACAKSARYFWIPGWHVIVCRTTLALTKDYDTKRHQRVQSAVRDAMRDSGQQW